MQDQNNSVNGVPVHKMDDGNARGASDTSVSEPYVPVDLEIVSPIEGDDELPEGFKEHIVSQADLDNSPSMAGLFKVGDRVCIPPEEALEPEQRAQLPGSDEGLDNGSDIGDGDGDGDDNQ